MKISYGLTVCNEHEEIKNLIEFILENKEEFLLFIKTLAKQEYKTFPMVFTNAQFVGGYNETNNHLECIKSQTLDFDVLF